MPALPFSLKFTLAEVEQAALRLLDASPQPVVARRLMHEVLRLAPDDPAYLSVKASAMSSKWVQQLEAAQLPDGSWGRFHTQDTKTKTEFRTTEEAIDRAFALGLEPSDHALVRVKQFIESVLQGKAKITDWMERNDSFPVLIRHFLAGRLAQIDPRNGMLDSFWEYVVEVARQAFSSGSYRMDDEVNAYLHLSGIHVPRGYLVSQYSLWTLSSRKLPPLLERSLVDWVWHSPHGIGYLGVRLSDPYPNQVGHWIRSMQLLARYPSWREIASTTANSLWDRRDEAGVWELQSVNLRSIDFPLSDSWRKQGRSIQDLSTCLLALLRRFYD